MADRINIPSSLRGEAGKAHELQTYNGVLTSTGDTSFTSLSSGSSVTYNTATYDGGTYANQGEEGLLAILQSVLSASALDATWANSKLDRDGGELITYTEDVEQTTGVSTSKNLDLDLYRVFEISLTGNTAITFSNIPATGTTCSWTLKIHQDATGRTVTFPSNVYWANGVTPNLSTASETSLVFFETTDGGTNIDASASVGFGYTV